MKFAWAIPSSVTYAECAALAELAKGRNVLEVGSWMGRSTIALASTADLVVSVDWHEGDFYAGHEDTLPALLDNLALYGASNVEVIVGRIEDVWQDLAPGFEMVFIDADHSEESASEHFRIAKALCPDGIICFHDYGRFGVTAALDALPYELEVVGSLAILREERDAVSDAQEAS